ncbi:MAG: hypothetical protein AAFX10_15645 [Pseudomonadota bacterium]
MPKRILEGGTDVAEMLLFSVDDLPSGGIDDGLLEDLARKNLAIRMPTGADGGYLLHLFVDVEVPDMIERYSDTADVLRSTFVAKSGRIAFGGAESAFQEFEPNRHIRADTTIPPGRYDATAYHTDYPDELIEEAVVAVIGRDGMRAIEFPAWIIGPTAILTIVFTVLGLNTNGLFLAAAAATVLGGYVWLKTFTGSRRYKELNANKLDVERRYPSIVIRLINATGAKT